MKQINDVDNNKRNCDENYELLSNCISTLLLAQEYYYFTSAQNLLYPFIIDEQNIIDCVKRDTQEYYMDFIRDSLAQIKSELATNQTILSSSMDDLITNHIEENPKSLQVTNNHQYSNENIDYIVECFPQLSKQHVQAYLEEYKCKADDLMDALLNDAIDVNFVKQAADNKKEVISAILSDHGTKFEDNEFMQGKIRRDQIHIGKRKARFNDKIDEELHKKILDIVCLQEEEEENEIWKLPTNTNLEDIYNDEFDDVYGMTTEFKNDSFQNNDEEEKRNKGIASSNGSSKSKIMESSKVSNNTLYHKRLQKKKEFSRSDKVGTNWNKQQNGKESFNNDGANRFSDNQNRKNNGTKEPSNYQDNGMKNKQGYQDQKINHTEGPLYQQHGKGSRNNQRFNEASHQQSKGYKNNQSFEGNHGCSNRQYENGYQRYPNNQERNNEYDSVRGTYDGYESYLQVTSQDVETGNGESMRSSTKTHQNNNRGRNNRGRFQNYRNRNNFNRH